MDSELASFQCFHIYYVGSNAQLFGIFWYTCLIISFSFLENELLNQRVCNSKLWQILPSYPPPTHPPTGMCEDSRNSYWTNYMRTINDLRIFFCFLRDSKRESDMWHLTTLHSLVEESVPKETKVSFTMAKEELPSISKDLQELQKKLSLLIESFQTNVKVSFQSPCVMENPKITLA